MKAIVQVVVDLVLDFPPSSVVIELWYAYPMQSDKSYYKEQPRIKLQPYFFLMTSCDRSGREDDVQVSWPGSTGLCHWWGWETATVWDRINLRHIKQKHFTRQPSDSAVSRQPWLAAASSSAAAFLFSFVFFSFLGQESHRQSFTLKSLIPTCIAIHSRGE